MKTSQERQAWFVWNEVPALRSIESKTTGKGSDLFALGTISFVLFFTGTILLSFSTNARAADNLQVRTLSTGPEMVSGGEALVEIDVPRDLSPGEISVTLDGSDISKEFRPGREPGALIGLVRGLTVGKHTVRVQAAGKGQKSQSAELDLAGC